MGDGSGDRCFSAIFIGGMDLDEGIAEVAQLDADRAVGGGDAFFFATESSAFDLFEAEAESGGFAEDKGGQPFGVLRKGKDGE